MYRETLTYLGVDDILALLLAFAASPKEIEVMMLSVTYGNVEVQRYLRILLLRNLLNILAQLSKKCCGLVSCSGKGTEMAESPWTTRRLRYHEDLQANRCGRSGSSLGR
jgi:hypothetical protein